tara:strand:+ start:668 stop:898 length:231 start_codon:yes stop_codon:yes gene_type:complete
MIKNTNHDGWDCVPELREVVEILNYNDTIKYEINNCVRTSTLNQMVDEMRESLEEAIEKLNEIDSNIEYKTIEEDY